MDGTGAVGSVGAGDLDGDGDVASADARQTLQTIAHIHGQPLNAVEPLKLHRLW